METKKDRAERMNEAMKNYKEGLKKRRGIRARRKNGMTVDKVVSFAEMIENEAYLR